MSSSSDPHQGGDLSDMAATGTTMPNDAGLQRAIPSVPRPDQRSENPLFTAGGGLGASTLAAAADNPTDIPRSTRDAGAGATTGEVLTGTGDQLPAQVESKRLHFGANDPVAKGHDRVAKHRKQKESDFERYAAEGAEVDEAPGEEGLGQDEIREGKGAQGEGGVL